MVLDGYIAEIWDGYWVKFEAKRIRSDRNKPHGVKYSLTLHEPGGKRIVGYDNAHAVPSQPASKEHDHVHKTDKMVAYNYKDAARLLEDFWRDVDRIIGRTN